MSGLGHVLMLCTYSITNLYHIILIIIILKRRKPFCTCTHKHYNKTKIISATACKCITMCSPACGRQSHVKKAGSSKGPERIVGGANSVEGEWPWQVSLHFSGNLYCGASVLSPDWLISAAHCFSRERSVILTVFSLSDSFI